MIERWAGITELAVEVLKKLLSLEIKLKNLESVVKSCGDKKWYILFYFNKYMIIIYHVMYGAMKAKERKKYSLLKSEYLFEPRYFGITVQKLNCSPIFLWLDERQIKGCKMVDEINRNNMDALWVRFRIFSFQEMQLDNANLGLVG